MIEVLNRMAGSSMIQTLNVAIFVVRIASCSYRNQGFAGGYNQQQKHKQHEKRYSIILAKLSPMNFSKEISLAVLRSKIIKQN